MTFRPLLLLLLLATSVTVFGQFGGKNTPVQRFRLPTFNKEGFRTSLLEGLEANAVSESEIQIREMRFLLFAGDEDSTLDTTLLAPRATVRIPEQNHYVVEGPGAVRLIREDLDVAGEQWTYDHKTKKLSIEKDVRVVFRSELKDILK